jgi:acetolactate synthase-1/2/3 large subunit
MKRADALLFLECDVPWIPSSFEPRADAFVAHVSADPLFASYPVRSFRSDMSLTATPAALLEALIPALEAAGAGQAAEQRRARAAAQGQAWRGAIAAVAAQDRDKQGPITKRFLSCCLNELRPHDAILVNEYSALREHLSIDEPGTFFQLPSSGGLGWGLPAALGAQQAAPHKVVIAVLGDGAYIFANPAACHQAAAMHDLPVLTIIFNNECWAGVQQAAQGMYPGAHSDRHVRERQAAPLSSLKPVPDFEKYVEASGGYGERVTERDALMPALQRALDVVTNERRQALVNVIGI